MSGAEIVASGVHNIAVGVFIFAAFVTTLLLILGDGWRDK